MDGGVGWVDLTVAMTDGEKQTPRQLAGMTDKACWRRGNRGQGKEPLKEKIWNEARGKNRWTDQPAWGGLQGRSWVERPAREVGEKAGRF